MARGAKKIMPVGDFNIAYDYREKNPSVILVGERHGEKLPGFDFGNSPSQIETSDFTDKIIVHTTSAGTQGIANATSADEILSGSLVNAKAIARYIKNKNPENVSLVCMGLDAIKQTPEDNLCAYYIKSLLEDNEMDLKPEIEKLRTTSGAKFFEADLQHIFPEKDYHLSVEANKFDFVLRLKKSDTDLDYMEKIDI